jgi:NlpC/P60 family putative phage cell wall peptidase
MPTPNDIITAARGWIATPYRHQASVKGVGCDCLGLIRGVWRDIHGNEPEAAPPYSPDWAEASGNEALAEAARRHMRELAIADAAPGDVLLFRWRNHLPAKHAGLLVGEARMIHAQESVGVAEVSLSNWWRRRIAFAFCFPGLG